MPVKKLFRFGIVAILGAVLLPCLFACGAAKDDDNTKTSTTTNTPSTSDATTENPEVDPTSPLVLNIVENGASSYQLIRADEAGATIKSSTSALMKNIQKRTGVTIKPASDWYNPRGEAPVPDGPEILIGETNRPESREVLDSLPAHSYAVVIRNRKLVIIGTDVNMTVLALYAFEQKVLDNPDKCAEGKLLFEEADQLTVTRDTALTLAEMIRLNYPISNHSQKVVQTAKQGEYHVGQGSCSDGTYAYFVLRNSQDTGSVITKHRLDNGEFVAVSDVLSLGHGNDMTFDTKNHRLVVAHGQSEGKILTLVDPDTLTLIRDINIPNGSGAITYSTAKDRYAISQGGSTLHILTSDFTWVASYGRIDKTGYTAQGMGSDEDFIYFPMSGSTDNVLVVYSWEGKYITKITVPVSHESESMFWVNNRYYIAYNTAGEALYEIVFEIVYQ